MAVYSDITRSYDTVQPDFMWRRVVRVCSMVRLFMAGKGVEVDAAQKDWCSESNGLLWGGLIFLVSWLRKVAPGPAQYDVGLYAMRKTMHFTPIVALVLACGCERSGGRQKQSKQELQHTHADTHTAGAELRTSRAAADGFSFEAMSQCSTQVEQQIALQQFLEKKTKSTGGGTAISLRRSMLC